MKQKMYIIRNPNKVIMKLLPDLIPGDDKYRWSDFCVFYFVSKGILVYNGLTGEVILCDEWNRNLSSKDNELPALVASEKDKDYLAMHRFIFPSSYDERELVREIRFILKALKPSKVKGISSYTILTTTECNARCFYCYEAWCKKVSMDVDTAHGIASWIINNVPDKVYHEEEYSFNFNNEIEKSTEPDKVFLTWFGGEPLCNADVMDIICQDLTDAHVEFSCSMITNGYLISDELIEKAENLWKLKRVQITLDGTREVYNRRKAFINDVDDAFEKVLSNIHMLLDNKINVSIRLNLDEDNYHDLIKLADLLEEQFHGKKSLVNVYSHLILQDELCDAENKLKCLYDQKIYLDEYLYMKGLFKLKKVGNGLKTNHCMADSCRSLVILPDGCFHSCEHIENNYSWGSITTGDYKTDKGTGLDEESTVLNYWEELYDESEECRTCFYYPSCIRIKHCPGINEKCSEGKRNEKKRMIEMYMESLYTSFLEEGIYEA